MTYAKGTSVSEEKSRQEIETALRKYAKDDFEEFIYRSARNEATVGFVIRNIRFAMTVTIPPQSDFNKTPTGKARKPDAAYKEWDQEYRRRWRSLAAVIKAKLIAINDGVATFENEFMPHIVMADGSTLSERMTPLIEQASSNNGLLRLEHIDS